MPERRRIKQGTDSCSARTISGQTWQTKIIPGGSERFFPYLSAIHPNDPQKIYVRLRGKDNDSAVTNRVIYSADGGESWQQIFEARADVLGFALSPDGNRVVLGLGDPRTPGRQVDESVLGLYAASTADHRFAPKRAGHVGCLTWSSDGLYLCGTYRGVPSDFELGLTTDEGNSIKQVMRLRSVEAPLECPSDTTVGRMCSEPSEWRRICELIGRCDPATGDLLAYPRGETCAPGSNPAGGASNTPDGGPGNGGTASGGTANGGTSNGDPNAAPDSLHIDKGCNFAQSGRKQDAVVLALLALAVLAARRRGQSRASRMH